MISRSISVLLLMITGAAASNGTNDGGLPRVVVSVFNDAEVEEAVLHRAGEQVVALFQGAGVELTWQECAATVAPRRCTDFESSGHLSLRIVRASANLKASVFGVAFLGEDGSGTQADIFFDEVKRLSAESGPPLETVLGHVAAHELGHLLLGTNAHSRSGIMRPRWTSTDLQSGSCASLQFLPEQAQRIREKLVLNAEIPDGVAVSLVRLP